MPKKWIGAAITLLFLAGCMHSGSTVEAASDAIDTVQRNLYTNKTDTEQTFLPNEAAMVRQRRVDADLSTEDTSESVTNQSEESVERQYFRFRRESRSQKNEEGICLLTENRCYTRFFGKNSELQTWIDEILAENRKIYDSNSQNLLQYAQEVILEYGSESFYTYSNYQDQGIARHDSRVVSLLEVSHLHSGGAHPSTVQTARNLDLQKQKVLKLEDVIYQNRVAELEQLVQSAVKNKFEHLGIGALYEDYPETISISMNYGNMTPYWYFDYGGLVVFYNQYELGPYAAGLIKVEIPYQKLHGILRKEFFPEDQTDSTCDLKAIADGTDLDQILCTIEPNGQQILISTEGTVQGVQVSEVLWVDETPVSQTMMISVSEMNEQDVLVLTGGFDDDNRSFAVEFSDGNGNRKTYFIHPDGLTEEP